MATRVPSYEDMLWPVLQVVIELGGSATIEQIDAGVIARGNYPFKVRGVLHVDHVNETEYRYRTEIQYRLAWARTYLKGMGLLAHGNRRGVWSVTPKGRKVTEVDVERLHAAYLDSVRLKAKQRREAD